MTTPDQSDVLEWLPHLTRSVSARRGTAVQLRPYRRGMDFQVFEVLRGGASADQILRVPLFERTTTSYDGVTDFRDVIRREVVVHRLLAQAGVPVPELLDYHLGDEQDDRSWQLFEKARQDDRAVLGEAELTALGDSAALMHGTDVAPYLDSLSADCLPENFTRRTWERLSEARKYVPSLPTRDALSGLHQALEALDAQPVRLLHMDLRAPNLCFSDGSLTAVLDYSNSAAGPPAVELGRISAYGLLTPAFTSAYERRSGGMPDPALIRACSVDTTALLVLLAAEELHDKAMLREQTRILTECLSRFTAPHGST